MKPAISPLRVLVKALCLFVIVNIVYALIDPQGSIVFGYNVLFPGRTRLPFIGGGGTFSVAIDDVDAMFASHAISAPKEAKEFRVVLLGDSSIWGEGLRASEMISEQWNELDIPCGDKVIKAYNLGYPHPSIVKDLVILDKAVEYEPDLIIWFVTLNALISQRINPFLDANRERALKVMEAYDIPFDRDETLREYEPGFYEKTLVARRSELARQIRLEMSGIVWAATGLDSNPLSVEGGLLAKEISDDPRYHGMQPPTDIKDMLLFSALNAGEDLADPVPVLVVNEPIFITNEDHSIVRYNAIYPHWVYDQYREHISAQAESAKWNYLDLWNAVPTEYFTDTGFHLSAAGERLLVEQLYPTLQSTVCAARPQNN